MAEKKRIHTGNKETAFKLKVDLLYVEKGEKTPEIMAYLFSSSGELLDSRTVTEKGTVTLKTDYGYGEQGKYKITVGPALEKVRELKKANARSTSVIAKIGKAVDVGMSVYKPDWGCWFGYRYDVVGDVKKRIKPDADTTIYAPVCTSIVEIYEVDYIGFMLKLPDYRLERFRDDLLRIPEEIEIPPKPLPDPPWPFVKKRLPGGVIEPIGKKVMLASAGPEITKSIKKAEAIAQPAAGQLNYTAIKQLSTTSFRRFVVDNIAIFKPYICLYLAGQYPKTLLGTAFTDTNGHFNKSLTFFCKAEQPDLYFKVKQFISGSMQYVYEPTPVPCHTYWNHHSGEAVHLIVTNALARCHFENPSVNKPGIYVMPIGIGNDGWWKIHQGHIKPPTAADSNRGLYHPDVTSTFDPYGKTLDLTMQFHDGLRNPAGPNVKYYRWSYQKDGDTGWTNIDTPIVHRYLDQTDPLHPKIKTYKLGPNPNPNPASSEDNLFEVPPDLDWYVEHDRWDRPFAKWDTTKLAGGNVEAAADKYTLKIEMFDAAGNKVTPTGAGFKFFVVEGSLVDDEWPVDDAPHVQPDGSILFNVHVDNNDTVAAIESVGFTGTTPLECQFLEYTDLTQDIEVKYQAYHPNGFLSHYNLKINRGMSGTLQSPADWLSVTDPAGPPITTPVAEGLTGVTVGDLLDTYNRCAFAVRLHTYPRTRNGYYRIREYEATDVGAFALVEK